MPEKSILGENPCPLGTPLIALATSICSVVACLNQLILTRIIHGQTDPDIHAGRRHPTKEQNMAVETVQSSASTVSEIERTTMRRVALRIVPFLMLCFLINFIDRINVGMAALTMNHDIGLKPTELAFGVS